MDDGGLAAMIFKGVISFFTMFGTTLSGLASLITGQELSPATRTVINLFFWVALASVALYFIISTALAAANKQPDSSPINVARVKEVKKEFIEEKAYSGTVPLETTLRQVPENQQFLVNFAPLTARVGGFMGPVKDGVFDAEVYCRNALKAGIRAFVLPISYHQDDNKDREKDTTKLWPAALEPAILFRNSEKQITSLNGITVQTFLEGLMTSLSANPSQQNDPILILIVESPENVPDKVRYEGVYANFLHKLGVQISKVPGLKDRIPTSIGSYGLVTQGQGEATLLMNLPITELKGKVLIATNFDCAIAKKSEYESRYRETLGQYTHFIIRSRSGKESSGQTRSMRVEDVSGSKEDWSNEARTFFLTSATEHIYEPSVYVPEEVQAALEKGIQCIPLPFFYNEPDTEEALKACHKYWNGTAWRVKPAQYRYTQPSPVTPSTPSTRLNARVNPSLQPGQTAIN